MSPSVEGAAIPTANYTSGTWRHQISATLASATSSVTDTNAASADRAEASAKLDAPITGTIT